MSIGVVLTLIVMSVILLGAALYTFSNAKNIKSGKQTQSSNSNNQ